MVLVLRKPGLVNSRWIVFVAQKVIETIASQALLEFAHECAILSVVLQLCHRLEVELDILSLGLYGDARVTKEASVGRAGSGRRRGTGR